MNAPITKLCDLGIERLDDDNAMLTQGEYSGEEDKIQLHRMHVVLLAEEFGLVRRTPAFDVGILRTEQRQLAELRRDLSRLKRQMLHARECADQLYGNISAVQLRGRDDVGVEMAQAAALADFTSEACADFESEFHVLDPEMSRSDRDISGTSNAPKNGGVKKTTKNGGVVKTETEPERNPDLTHEKPLGYEHGDQIGLEV